MMKISNWRTFILITLTATALWALLFYLNACAPPPRFSNGDKTALAPDVVEPDMPGYVK